MANSITLTSDSYFGREFIFTVIQYETSTTVNWTLEVTKMDPGNGTLADVSDINCTINGHSVYSYPATGWSQSTKFPVYYGSTSGSYDIGSYGTFSVVLSGRPGYSSPTSKSGTITLTQPAPPSPTVNTISVQPIPEFIAGYDGDSFTLTCNPSGGTGYTYKWYKYADYYGDSVIIDESQTLTGTLYNDNWDNNYIYCVVTDSTGGTATTNRCQLRVGTSASQTQVSTKQIQPVRIYNGNAGARTETWVINDNAAGEFATTQISFTSNGQKFTSIGANSDYGAMVLYYDNTEVAGYDPGTSAVYEFYNEAHRKLTFDTPPTGALLTWLQSNATKQAATINEKDFLYGIPFIYNSGWKYNSWNITYTGNNRANIAIAGNAIVG